MSKSKKRRRESRAQFKTRSEQAGAQFAEDEKAREDRAAKRPDDTKATRTKPTLSTMLTNFAGYAGVWIAGLGALACAGAAYIWAFAKIGQ